MKVIGNFFLSSRPTDRTDQILEIVPNLRLLTWIILGTLNHMAESVAKRKELIHCIPLSESSRLAENVELVFSLTFRISENVSIFHAVKASVTRCNFPCHLSRNDGNRNPFQVAGDMLHCGISGWNL